MLNYFRKSRLAHFSVQLIILSLLIKMLMPVAHASTAVSGEKSGFFAALCTANGVVLVNSNDLKPSESKPQINSNNACPLCLLLEQGLFDSTIIKTNQISFNTQHEQFKTYFDVAAINPLPDQQSYIRAPPAQS